jgi:hypothetical protein
MNPIAIPSWLKFVDLEQGQLSDRYVVGGPPTLLPSGDSLALDFIVGSQDMRAGTALGTVSFGILGGNMAGADNGDGLRSCDDYSRDATFDVFLTISPPQELNQIGDSRYVGLALMILTLMTSFFFGCVLYRYRRTAILKTMQPLFLITVCCGGELASRY